MRTNNDWFYDYFIDEVKAIRRNCIPKLQSDWNQNDDTQPDYVKNRPFYTGVPVETVLVEESAISFDLVDGPDGSAMCVKEFPPTFEATVGETYKVSWDGTVYECTSVSSGSEIRIGNPFIMGGPDTGEPFLIIVINGDVMVIVTADTSASHTFSISRTVAPIVKIDKKYLVQPDWNQNDDTQPDYVKNRPFYIADEAYIGTLSFTATSNNTMDYTYTGVDGEIFSYFQKLQNAGEVIKVKIGTRSGLMSSTFDRGRFGFSGILSGSMAWRTGEIWTATINDENITLVNGNAYNVVFYDITTPGHIPIDVEFLPSSVHTDNNAPVKHGSGDASVIEGSNTTASGTFSHAEGANTTASGGSSHAEGSSTTASNSSSHAEGSNTTASGIFSHAEGSSTTASGSSSHAEGINTKASSHWQHVQGKYNVEDTAAIYAHVVGNGNKSTRSNAHTLDWDGNAWFASDVYVGSTSGINKDEGSQKLATETYVDSMIDTAIGEYANTAEYIIHSSTSGSTKKFKITVDDTGTISATEVT